MHWIKILKENYQNYKFDLLMAMEIFLKFTRATIVGLLRCINLLNSNSAKYFILSVTSIFAYLKYFRSVWYKRCQVTKWKGKQFNFAISIEKHIRLSLQTNHNTLQHVGRDNFYKLSRNFRLAGKAHFRTEVELSKNRW